MKLDELKEHCLKTLKHTEKFPTKTFEEHALVLQLIENQTSVVAKLENIKERLNHRANEHLDGDYYVCIKDINEVFDEEIAEIKGEQNDTN